MKPWDTAKNPNVSFNRVIDTTDKTVLSSTNLEKILIKRSQGYAINFEKQTTHRYVICIINWIN